MSPISDPEIHPMRAPSLKWAVGQRVKRLAIARIAVREVLQKSPFSKYVTGQNASVKTVLGVIVLLLVASCSREQNASPQALAFRLKDADRLNVAGVRDPDGTVGMTITGEDLSKMVQALSSGQKEPPNIPASPDLRLEFYKGGGHLTTITNSGIGFWIGSTLYSDRSGTFEKLLGGFHGMPARKSSP